ncbi:hypothetical protein N7523_001593 [Penicillium sp. IBT 18751x]|nr:hypothetical protein N7523_001593 [Penicillium sp. IBT 18751x]
MTDLPRILSVASGLRQGTPCTFANEKTHQGGSHRVFKIIFSDSVQWAARVPHNLDDWRYEVRAIKQFQYIKKSCSELNAPDLLFEEDYPILYSQWVTGTPLTIWNLQIPLHQRQKFLDDFADFLLQLWTTTVPATLSSKAKGSYTRWLTESLDRGLKRTLNGTGRWGNASDHLIMRSMIPEYADLDLYTEIGFDHGDLNAYNVLIGEDFNLTGVIDWDWLSVAPFTAVIHHPWFIADIPGWHNEGAEFGVNFEGDRQYLEEAIRRREIQKNMETTISSLLRGSGKRFLFQSAFHVKDVHTQFVQTYCQITEANKAVIREQLDIVLGLYPELAGKVGVTAVRDLLRTSSG